MLRVQQLGCSEEKRYDIRAVIGIMRTRSYVADVKYVYDPSGSATVIVDDDIGFVKGNY
jgi:hypothetical protein